jgi:hypothetical protein
MRVVIRAAVLFAIALLTSRAAADQFLQARCEHPQHRAQWHGPRRSSRQAFRDADEHNRRHRGHLARVLVVARE